jgi:hypothetical protein
MEFVMDAKVTSYRWSEVIDVQFSTATGPGRYPCLKMVPKMFNMRDHYKSMCIGLLGTVINFCPCMFKYREKLPRCCQWCPPLVETAGVKVALNSEGFSFNPFYDW